MNVPSKEQIEVALVLHKEIGDWQRKDDVLRQLKERNPDFFRSLRNVTQSFSGQ